MKESNLEEKFEKFYVENGGNRNEFKELLYKIMTNPTPTPSPQLQELLRENCYDGCEHTEEFWNWIELPCHKVKKLLELAFSLGIKAAEKEIEKYFNNWIAVEAENGFGTHSLIQRKQEALKALHSLLQE